MFSLFQEVFIRIIVFDTNVHAESEKYNFKPSL